MPEDLIASNFILNDDWRQCLDKQPERRGFRRKPKSREPCRNRQLSWSGIAVLGESSKVHRDVNTRFELFSYDRMLDHVLADFKAHTSYWDQIDADSASVFDGIDQKLFPQANEAK